MAIHADAPVAPERSACEPSRTKQLLAARMAIATCVLFAASAPNAGEIEAVVGTLSPSVSWSVGDSKPVATYTVTLKNMSASNTINNGRLVATTTVSPATAGTQALYKSANGAICGVSLGGTRVDCSVDSLAPGQSKSFTLNFISPTAGNSIELAWDAVFDAGTPPGNSNGNSGTEIIALTGIAATGVLSAVPPNEEVAVYTGYLALPSSSDQFTTAIKVPNVNTKSSTASVVEADISFELNCTNLRNFKRCFSSSIDIPDVIVPWSPTDYLTFTLSIDKSNFRGGAKIDKTLIRYTEDGGVSYVTVQFCSVDQNGPVPNKDQNGLCTTPCIKKANDYSSRKSPLGGWYGFQWEIISCKNGSFEIF